MPPAQSPGPVPKPLTPEPVKDSVDLPGKPYAEASPVKKLLGTVLSVVSLALSLVSMGMLRLPKVPVLSAPFFALVLGAFVANEAIIAAADAAQIPTVHHSESLRKVLTAPGYWFSRKVLEKIWPVFLGGEDQKKALIEAFAQKNDALIHAATSMLIQNPLFEDLSLKLRDKRNFSEKAIEIAQSFGKVLIALAVGSLLPKPIRAWMGPWLTNLLGFPLMERILSQFDQDPNTPGVQLTKPTDKPADTKANGNKKSNKKPTGKPLALKPNQPAEPPDDGLL